MENFTLDSKLLHNQRLWWLWQTWGVTIPVLLIHPSPTHPGCHFTVSTTWAIRPTCLWAFELVRFVSRSWAIQPTWEPQLSLCLETLFRSYNTGEKFICEKEKKKRKVDSSWNGMFYGNHPRGQAKPCLDLLMQIIVILTVKMILEIFHKASWVVYRVP